MFEQSIKNFNLTCLISGIHKLSTFCCGNRSPPHLDFLGKCQQISGREIKGKQFMSVKHGVFSAKRPRRQDSMASSQSFLWGGVLGSMREILSQEISRFRFRKRCINYWNFMFSFPI